MNNNKSRLLTEKDFWFIFCLGFACGGMLFLVIDKIATAM